MNRTMLMLLIAFALVIVTPRIATAAPGTISGLTVTPTTVPAGATVTIQVQGKDTCGAGTLTFGDGQQIPLTNVKLPYSTKIGRASCRERV